MMIRLKRLARTSLPFLALVAPLVATAAPAVHYGAGEVAVSDKDGFPFGTISLPKGAGLGTTNLTF